MKKNLKYIIIIILAITAVFIFKYLKDNKLKEYEIVEIKNDNYFLYQHDGKYGVIDKDANIVILPSYEQVAIPNPEKSLFVCYEDEQTTKIYDSKRNEILTQFEEVKPISLRNIDSNYVFEKSVLVYKEEDKYGLIDFDGNKITSALYSKIEAFPNKEGELLVSQNNKFGVININGYKLVPCQYDDIKIDDYFVEGDEYKFSGFIVKNKTEEGFRYGYYNYEGKKILDTSYTTLQRANYPDKDKQYLTISSYGQYGVYLNNKFVIPQKFSNIDYDANANIFIVEQQLNVGAYNINGDEIIPCDNSEIKTSNNYLYVTKGDEKFVYDTNGKLTNLDSSYMVNQTANSKYSIKINMSNNLNYSIVDSSNNELTQGYSYLSYLIGNKFITTNGTSLGIVDTNDDLVVDFENCKIQKVNGYDIIEIQKDNSDYISLYDEDLNIIIEEISPNYVIENNYLISKNENNEKKYVDLNTKKEVKNYEVYPNNKLISFLEDGMYGFKDKNGNVVIEAEYDDITELNQYGYAGIKKDDKWGIINSNGEVILEPTYYINYDNVTFLGKYYRTNYSTGNIVFSDVILEPSNNY